MASSRQRRPVASGSSCAILLALASFLPGCPPSDDYFIDTAVPGSGGVGGSDAGGGAGKAGGSGALGGSSQAGSAGGSASAGVGSGGSGGTGTPICDEPCSAGRSCSDECESGWVTTSVPPGGLSPRVHAAYVGIGNQLFVWGGCNESGTALNSGALYDPRTDAWRTIASDANTPSPRCAATAVWTGSVVVVWGGHEPATDRALADGAIYDPVEDTWRSMVEGPKARVLPIGGSGEGRALFWAGRDGGGSQLSGLDLYDIENGTWSSADSEQEPTLREEPAWAAGNYTFWTYGGRMSADTASDRAAYYSIESNEWNELEEGATEPRWGAFGAFIGGNFHVWGGRDVGSVYADGVVYSSSDWDGIDEASAPSARYAASGESGWVFPVNDSTFVVIGGLSGPGEYLQDGAFYDSSEDAWTAIPAWPGAASHAFGAAAWVGGELVVWGGRDGTSLTNTGVRYLPPN